MLNRQATLLASVRSKFDRFEYICTDEKIIK